MAGRERLGSAGLLVGSLVVSLLLGEMALRLTDYSYTPLDIQAGSDQDRRLYHAFEDDKFEYDPELLWAPRKGHGIFNRDGFRGPLLSDVKRPGETRIFAVGDSNTLGWDGADGPNWPGYLGEILKASGDRTVLNAGVYGYTSFQGVRRLKQCLERQPDLVLVSFGSNDALRVTVSDAEFALQRGRWASLERGLMGYRLGQLLLAVRDRASPRNETRTLRPRVSVEQYRSNLAEMARLGKERGVTVVFLTRPYYGESHDDTWWKRFAADYNEATVDVAARMGAPVVDVYTHFRDASELFADESHFTQEGHRQAAALIAQSLLPLLE